jgi:hypothetical protein
VTNGDEGMSAVLPDDPDSLDQDKLKLGFIMSCTARVVKPGLVIEMNQEDAFNSA